MAESWGGTSSLSGLLTLWTGGGHKVAPQLCYATVAMQMLFPPHLSMGFGLDSDFCCSATRLITARRWASYPACEQTRI